MPENCAAIIIAAKHHELIKVKDTRGTTNTVGALRCKFQFRTEDWLHSAKTAMFCNGDAVLHPEVINGAISVPLDADDECPVPYEVLTDTLPYSVGVWGITDTGLRVVSNWLVFNAQVGCYTEGNAPGDPEQTVYDEIRLISQEAVDAANEVVQRANSGEFDGKSAYELAVEDGFEGTVQEWLDSLVGVDGKDGYTPIKGVDYSDGKDGKDGYTPIKGVDYFDGVNGKDGYTPVKGVDYFDGKNGKDGADGKDGYTPVKGIDYFDGKDGTNGKDGYTPVKGVDYVDGKDGADGKDGVSVTHLWSGTTLSITSASGTSSVDLKGEKGDAPVKGKDYFTPEDVDGIVDKVLEQMPEGGVSSWNDLTDKPFGEEPITFIWDGVISEDTIMAEAHGAPFVKVSDKVLSVSDCVGGTLVYVLRGAEGSATLPEYMISDMDGCIVAGEFNILSTANTSGVLEGQPYELPAPGTYFLAADWMFTKSLTLTSGGIKTLDEKFIPDTIARKEDLKNLGGVTSWNDLTDRPFGEEGIAPITWDGVIGDRPVEDKFFEQNMGVVVPIVKVSDVVLSVEEMDSGTVTMSTGEVWPLTGNPAEMGEGLVTGGDGMIFSVASTDPILFGDTGTTVTFPETGTYFTFMPDASYVATLTFPGGGIKTLDPKYLPKHEHSWNDLTDKPFGEESSGETVDIIIYDETGVVMNYETLLSGLMGFPAHLKYIAVDELPSNEDAEYGYINMGQEAEMFLYYVKGTDDIYVADMNSHTLMEVTRNHVGYDIAGVINDISEAATPANSYILYTTGTTIKTIDEKYIPDTIARVTATPTSIDLSGFETEGKIVETMPDGTTKTTTVEFDADGNIIKITDADGNETALVW